MQLLHVCNDISNTLPHKKRKNRKWIIIHPIYIYDNSNGKPREKQTCQWVIKKKHQKGCWSDRQTAVQNISLKMTNFGSQHTSFETWTDSWFIDRIGTGQLRKHKNNSFQAFITFREPYRYNQFILVTLTRTTQLHILATTYCPIQIPCWYYSKLTRVPGWLANALDCKSCGQGLVPVLPLLACMPSIH